MRAICVQQPARPWGSSQSLAAVGPTHERQRGVTAAALGVASAASPSEVVTDGDLVRNTTATAPVVVVDWMAKWCRKCIYLRPKLERFMEEEFSGVPLLCVDVNAMPGDVIKQAGVTKMPTLQLWQNGVKTGELIGGTSWPELEGQVREMLQQNIQQ